PAAAGRGGPARSGSAPARARSHGDRATPATGATPQGCARSRASGRNVDGRWRLLEQLGKQLGDLVTHLPAIHDHVQRAVLEQELAALETLGQRLAHGLLDDTRTGEADQGIRLGDIDV